MENPISGKCSAKPVVMVDNASKVIRLLYASAVDISTADEETSHQRGQILKLGAIRNFEALINCFEASILDKINDAFPATRILGLPSMMLYPMPRYFMAVTPGLALRDCVA